MKITLYRDIKDTTAPFNKDVTFVLDRIKSGYYQNQINSIRSEKDEDLKRRKKGELVSICFSGTFRQRKDDEIIKHSGLICLDFDKVPDAEMEACKAQAVADPYTMACFVSPSGNGYKILTKIPPEKENHKEYFKALASRWEAMMPIGKYIDTSGSNLSRVCYISADPDMYYNPSSELWSERDQREESEIGAVQVVIPIRSENHIVDRLLKWWKEKYGMTANSRNTNMFKLAAAFNDFGISQKEGERVLANFSEKDFTEGEIKLIVKSAYKNKGAFHSKYLEDTVTKQRIEKQIRSGKTESEIVKEFPEVDGKDVTSAIEAIRENISVTDFWTYDKNGAMKLMPHKFKFFLEQHTFRKYYPQGSGLFMFIKIQENLVEKTSKDVIKDYVLNNLMERKDLQYYPFDYMADNAKFFKEDYLSLIDSEDLEIKRDTAGECFLYYRNCCVTITKDRIEAKEYIDIDGFVWKEQVIGREYNVEQRSDEEVGEFPPTDCVFKKFIQLISGNDSQRYASFVSVIGYMLHSYKNSANNKAIILNDETISENPNGGSGKGIFWNALAKMKKLDMIDGKTVDFNKSFVYQTVSPDSQILVFDDVKKNFRFESLFSVITEGITIEKKNQNAIRLPVSQSPKILITTNYTIGGSGGSFDRRKFELELSSHFSSQHTPLDEFGHNLFDDWTAEEWEKFDRYMISCVQSYLRTGLVAHRHYNLEARKFIKETKFEFYEWCKEDPNVIGGGNIPIGRRFCAPDIMDAFIKEYPDFKYGSRPLNQKWFSQWIDSFAKFHSCDVLRGKNQEGRWTEIRLRDTENGEADEFGAESEKQSETELFEVDDFSTRMELPKIVFNDELPF